MYVENYGQKKVDTDFSGPMGFIKLMQAMMGGDYGVQAATRARRSPSSTPSARS